MADTPLAAIVVAGAKVSTEDKTGRRCLIAEATEVEMALWIAYSLSQFHRVPQKVEPLEAEIETIELKMNGRVIRKEHRVSDEYRWTS